jgi:hypothetical protein
MFLIRFETDRKIALAACLRRITGMDLNDGIDAMREGLIVKEEQIGTLVCNLDAAVKAENHRLDGEKTPTNPLAYTLSIAPYQRVPQPVKLAGFAF